MFIGREQDLTELDQRYMSNKFEFVVIYGPRHVGKTALINQFVHNKKVIYFTGVESSAKQNLESLTQSIRDDCGVLDEDVSFSSFYTALEYVFRRSKQERIVLVIDEYPHVARASKNFASVLQVLIDRYQATSKLMLILCGSSASYMEKCVFAQDSVLYGKWTARISLLPFRFEEVYSYFEHFTDVEKLYLYGIVGGTPQYLLQMDDGLSFEENLKLTCLNPNSILFEEPQNFLKREVREPALYNAILTAIAAGASRMSEISHRVGEETNICSVYLKNLVSLGVIQKNTPYGEPSSRRVVYSIVDPMFRFWYRFVPENFSMLARGAVDEVYQRILPSLQMYMQDVFVEICKQYLYKLRSFGTCPITFSSLGSWWGSRSKEKDTVRIDILGQQDQNTALFGNCKWMDISVGLDVLEKFVGLRSLFSYRNVSFFLFSKVGFTKECVHRASMEDQIHLISYQDIVSSFG